MANGRLSTYDAVTGQFKDPLIESRFYTLSAGTNTTLTTKIANYTLIPDYHINVFNGVGLTATLPSAVVSGTGRTYTVKNINASALTVASVAGTIDGAATQSLNQWQSRRYVSDGSNWLVIGSSGDSGGSPTTLTEDPTGSGAYKETS